MRYHQITSEERHTLATLRKQHFSCTEIAEIMGRHRSTIYRELGRNRCRYDGGYRYVRAKEQASARRKRSHRNGRLTAEDWLMIEELIEQDLSPEQVSGLLKRHRMLQVSHETIYQHIWRNKQQGGTLYSHLRQRTKYRKRYGSYEKRGKVAGKQHISERPAAVEHRQEMGHWEMDTVVGTGTKDCIVSLVERATGCVLIGKLRDRTVAALNQRLLQLIGGFPQLFKTITADNGTEFHGYREVEQITGVPIYFATPYHSWERGTNENTNGLIRQYLPKGASMKGVTQQRCNEIACILNNRPRKRYAFFSPIEMLYQHLRKRLSSTNVSVAVQT
jgi:transposase, IS30 family